MQKSKMAVSGSLTNSCEKKRSEKHDFVIRGLLSKGLAVPFLLREREGVLAAHSARTTGPFTGKG